MPYFPHILPSFLVNGQGDHPDRAKWGLMHAQWLREQRMKAGRPDNFHYDAATQTWDNNFSPGTGVYEDHDGWRWTSFIMGNLQTFGPVGTEEEARRRHKEDMDEGRKQDEEDAVPAWPYEDDGEIQ